MLLFLTTNLAAVTSCANQQYVQPRVSWCSCLRNSLNSFSCLMYRFSLFYEKQVCQWTLHTLIFLQVTEVLPLEHMREAKTRFTLGYSPFQFFLTDSVPMRTLQSCLASMVALLISLAFCFNLSSFSFKSFSFFSNSLFLSSVSMAARQLRTSNSSSGDSCKND